MSLAPLVDSTNLLEQSIALGERAARDGYLWLPGLLDPSVVEAARARVEAACHSWSSSSANSPPLHWQDPRFVAIQGEVLPSPELAALANHPRLTGALTALFGRPPVRLHGDVCRIVHPHAPATPPHQDAFYLRSAPLLWAAWIPLTDCPLPCGPLAVMPGSHLQGLRPHQGQSLDELCAAIGDDEPRAAGPLAVGDALLFHAATVHFALPNCASSTRLSVDFRYV